MAAAPTTSVDGCDGRAETAEPAAVLSPSFRGSASEAAESHLGGGGMVRSNSNVGQGGLSIWCRLHVALCGASMHRHPSRCPAVGASAAPAALERGGGAGCGVGHAHPCQVPGWVASVAIVPHLHLRQGEAAVAVRC
jgi:hypothetical protein